MVTTFANVVGQIPQNDIAQDLANINLNPEQINTAMNFRPEKKNRFVIPKTQTKDKSSSTETNLSDASGIDHEKLKKS